MNILTAAVVLSGLVVAGIWLALWAFDVWPFRSKPEHKTFLHPSRVEFNGVDLSHLVDKVEIAYSKKNDHNPGGGPNVDTVIPGLAQSSFTVSFERTDSVSNGLYLTRDGEQHKCKPPVFKWKRGSTLKNVWMCECGKRWRIKAYGTKQVDSDWVQAFKIQVVDRGRPLSYYDVLRIGNREETKRVVVDQLDRFRPRYKEVPLSSEEIINRDVVFVWERITRKPKEAK